MTERRSNSGCMEIPGCVAVPQTLSSSTRMIQVCMTPTQTNGFQELV